MYIFKKKRYRFTWQVQDNRGNRDLMTSLFRNAY